MYSRRESCSCITANVSLRLWNSRYLPQRRSGTKRVKLEGWISSVNSSAKALRRESERENSCICLFIEIDTRSSRSTQNQPTNGFRQKQNLLEGSQWFIHPTNHFYWAIESLFLLQGSVGSLRWILVPDVLTPNWLSTCCSTSLFFHFSGGVSSSEVVRRRYVGFRQHSLEPSLVTSFFFRFPETETEA